MMQVLSDLSARKGAKAQRGNFFAALRLCVKVSLFMLVLGVGTAVAQSEVSAEMMLRQKIGLIGEVIDIDVTVTHPEGYRIVGVDLDNAWKDLEAQSNSWMVRGPTDDGSEVSSFLVQVVLWELGEFVTPPLLLTVSDPNGELIEVVAAPVIINIESVLTDDDLALRDIKPQATLPLAVWWPWLVGILGLAGVLGAFWWRGRGGETAVPFVDSRTLQQIALDELDEIAASGLAERGDFKEHYAQTTDVLRRYLDGTFATMTQEQTTAEIRRAVQPLDFANDEKKRLVNLLNEADLVKFAKVRPTLEDARRATTAAKTFVAAIGIDD